MLSGVRCHAVLAKFYLLVLRPSVQPNMKKKIFFKHLLKFLINLPLFLQLFRKPETFHSFELFLWEFCCPEKPSAQCKRLFLQCTGVGEELEQCCSVSSEYRGEVSSHQVHISLQGKQDNGYNIHRNTSKPATLPWDR